LHDVSWTSKCGALGANERGIGYVQALILVSFIGLGAAVGFNALGLSVRDKATCVGEAIAGLAPGAGRCRDGESLPGDALAPRQDPGQGAPVTSPEPQLAGGGPDQGPPLGDGQPIAVLPFPGSISVSCTGGKNDDGKYCKGPSDTTGVKVVPSGTRTVSRSPTKLNAKGCPQQTLAVSTEFKLEVAGGGEVPDDEEDGTADGSGSRDKKPEDDKPEKKKPKATGKLQAFLAEKTTYSVTVSPDQAEAIEDGKRRAPNPLDPSSILPGESIQMSEEFYARLGLSAEYRALQVDLGYDKGRRVSSGVTRLPGSDSHVRVYVGDEEFVRQALAFGIGGNGAKLSVGLGQELAEGKLRAVDINIATPEGWNAYQQFLATGRLPERGATGASNPTASTTTKFTDSATLEAQLGKWSLGGQLKDAEGNLVDTRHADGKREQSFSIRYNDVGLEVTARQDAKGNPIGERTYALNLEGVDPDVYSRFQELNANDPTPPPDGNARFEFTRSDLLDIREQALNTIAAQMERNGAPRLSAQEVADILERNNGRIIYGPHGVEFHPQPPVVGLLANSRTPEEVLEALYRLAGGNANDLLRGPLTEFTLAVKAANGDQPAAERGSLPGNLGGPRGCGA
jgi:hypothetical protein